MTTASPTRLSWLVALLTATTLELVRSSGPLLDMAFGVGVVAAAGTALTTYAAPGLLVVVLALAARRRGPVTALVGGAVLLAIGRLAVQGLDAGLRFGVGLATVALAVGVLTLAVGVLAARPDGGRLAAGSLALGAAAGVGLQLGLGTWDAYWRDGLLGWGVAAVLACGLAWLAVGVSRDPASATDPELRATRLWTLGPVLALAAMMLANPAFAASQTGLPLVVAGPVTAVGLLLAGLLVAGATTRTTPGTPAAQPTTSSGALPAAIATPALVGGVLLLAGGPLPLPSVVEGALVLVMLVGAQLGAITLLGNALLPRRVLVRSPLRTALRAAGAATLVGLGTILPLLVFQLDYDIPLGFPNALVVVVTAVVLGLGGALRRALPDVPADPRSPDAAPHTRGAPITRGTGTGARPARTALVTVAAVVVLLGSVAHGVTALGAHLASRPVDGAVPGQPLPQTTVVSWNLHYGVSPAGDVDLEQVARTIEEQDACVVLLQEVSRGWVMGGGVDMGSWLATRLGMRLAFAPAADRQFGNAILSCHPPRDVVVHDLPYGVGPQDRSAISASVDLGAEEARFTSVHLQHRESSTPTRLAQLEVLLAVPDLGLIGGDLNSEPGWAEIAMLVDAGYLSAQDALGDPTALTSPSLDPRHRIDWIFTPGPAAELSDFRILADAHSSDHLPLVVTLTRAP